YDFCTIITADYLAYAIAQYDSLSQFNRKVCLHILVCDNENRQSSSGLQFYNLVDFKTNEDCKILLGKYGISDEFRWSMKPVFLIFLLKNKLDKIIYLDSDIHFFNDFSFLFVKLNSYKILLTPHW